MDRRVTVTPPTIRCLQTTTITMGERLRRAQISWLREPTRSIGVPQRLCTQRPPAGDWQHACSPDRRRARHVQWARTLHWHDASSLCHGPNTLPGSIPGEKGQPIMLCSCCRARAGTSPVHRCSFTVVYHETWSFTSLMHHVVTRERRE